MEKINPLILKWSLKILLTSTCVFFIGCKSEDIEDEVAPIEDSACFESGDILVANGGSDSVVALDSAGNFKRTVYSVNTSAGEALFGLDLLESTGELLVVVDGVDRVMAISPVDCSARIFIADLNLTGTVRGITQLTSGDLLVVETNAIERFTSSGLRVTTGGFPLTLQTAGTQLSNISGGGFILCSTGTDVVRTYSDAGVQSATRSSGIVGTTDASGCMVLASGNIATVWSGTTDTVSIYNPGLSSSLFTYSNPSVLATPGGMAQRANGNILVTERTLNYLVEITQEGVLVGTLGSGSLNTPEFLLVVP